MVAALFLGAGMRTKSDGTSFISPVSSSRCPPTSRMERRTTWYVDAFFLSMKGFLFFPMVGGEVASCYAVVLGMGIGRWERKK